MIRSLCKEWNRSTWSQLGTANSNNGASNEKPLHCTQGERDDAKRNWELVSFAWVGGGRKNDGLVSDLELLIINFIWGQVFSQTLNWEEECSRLTKVLNLSSAWTSTKLTVHVMRINHIYTLGIRPNKKQMVWIFEWWTSFTHLHWQ